MRTLIWSDLDDAERAAALARPDITQAGSVMSRVTEIVTAVRNRGDAALRKLTVEIDRVEVASLAVSASEFDQAEESLSPGQRQAIVTAARNIERFHEAQRPTAIDLETMPGVRCERVYRPIRRVGLYVPAGTAPLPSTALMLGIPAQIAGCPLRVLCSPPRPDGSVDPAVLFAARLSGIERVFRVGGAQAIAAMAYGTESIPKVDKLFGPGNVWVTEAKEQVARDAGGAARDYPAGPSEVLVIADESADAEFVATDLLSQAEHGHDSQALLLTTSADLAERVDSAVKRFAATLPRARILRISLGHARIIVVDTLETAIELSNRYAPEHLIIQTRSPRALLDRVDAAGSVFLGPWSPESMGDYCSGTNHVLPTYGYARSYSSLGLADFCRSMSVQELDETGIAALGPVAETLAELEGLAAHGLAARIRLDRLDNRGDGP